MTSTNLPVNDLADFLIQRKLPILICDTCALLDIIRMPFRQTELTRLISIQSAITEIFERSKQGTISLVVSPLVKDEWAANAPSVQRELENHLKKLEGQNEIIREVASGQGTSLPEIILPIREISDHQLNLSQDLLKICHGIEEDESIMLKAKDRAVKYIPPSSKGAIKDCIIYEHALELLRILELKGFTYPKIFLTSNTKDFCGENRRPKSPIDTELNTVSTELCLAWDWALKELKLT